MNMWRVGEDMGSKETDGCPLTSQAVGLLSAGTVSAVSYEYPNGDRLSRRCWWEGR
jgi:hypothetical protein